MITAFAVLIGLAVMITTVEMVSAGDGDDGMSPFRDRIPDLFFKMTQKKILRKGSTFHNDG